MHACTVCCPCYDTTGGVIDHYWDKQTLSVSQVLPWTVYQFPAIHTFRWVPPKNWIITKKCWCLSIVIIVLSCYHILSSCFIIFPYVSPWSCHEFRSHIGVQATSRCLHSSPCPLWKQQTQAWRLHTWRLKWRDIQIHRRSKPGNYPPVSSNAGKSPVRK